MTLTATLASGLQLFASATFSRGHHAPVAAGASAYTRATTQPPTIEQVLAGRAVGSGLAMRWSTDKSSLRATWASPKLGS